MLGDDRGHGSVVDGEDGDGLPPVDLGGHAGQGQVVVEDGEVRMLRQDEGYVVSLRRRSNGGEDDEDEVE